MVRVRLVSAAIVLPSLLILLAAGGCNQAAGKKAAGAEGRTLLSVEFPKDAVLRYHITSSRNIVLDLDSSGKMSKNDSGARQEMKEEAELAMAYRAVGPAGRGGTQVEAKCESATVRRQRLSGGSTAEDALATLAGKTFTISVSATGQIFETADLEKVIHDLGEAAFGSRADRYEGRRIKNPDMVADFITVQWYMWDQEQSVPRPTSGVAVGEQWKSKRKPLAPFPFIARTGRDVAYTLTGVEKSPEGDQLATIKSVYSLAEGQSMDWPIPYTGTFSQRGSFGFFQGYKVLELSGEGTQVFDVTTGSITSDNQKYTARISAVIPFGGLGKDGEKPEPNIVIDQTITMELLPAATPVK